MVGRSSRSEKGATSLLSIVLTFWCLSLRTFFAHTQVARANSKSTNRPPPLAHLTHQSSHTISRSPFTPRTTRLENSQSESLSGAPCRHRRRCRSAVVRRESSSSSSSHSPKHDTLIDYLWARIYDGIPDTVLDSAGCGEPGRPNSHALA